MVVAFEMSVLRVFL